MKDRAGVKLCAGDKINIHNTNGNKLYIRTAIEPLDVVWYGIDSHFYWTPTKNVSKVMDPVLDQQGTEIHVGDKVYHTGLKTVSCVDVIHNLYCVECGLSAYSANNLLVLK